MKKYNCLFLLVVSFSNFGIIAQQANFLYCSVEELDALCKAPEEFKKIVQRCPEDKSRLSKLEKNKDAIFWHLKDPAVGMQLSSGDTCKHQPLSWNFLLWDLAPKKGRNSSIATIDAADPASLSSQNLICERCAKLTQGKPLWRDSQLHGDSQDRLTCESCKKDFFSYFVKHISLFHGMCSRNIILQIAPEVNITTYDIFDNHGYGSSKKLCATLQSIAKQSIAKKDFDIVHLGLKITDKQISQKDKEELSSHLRNMNYVVAAAGNDVASKHVAYPARCPEVTFDVGAFYKNSIAKFSQFESDIGPKVVAPGVQVFCPITMQNYETIGYFALSGTSTAAAIVTGFLALVISEFKSEPPGSLAFSREEIVTVIYGSTYKLADSAEWQQKVLLGAIDMRSALFYLHVLREIKSKIPLKTFQKSYHKLFEKMREINELGANLVAPKNACIPLRNSSGLDFRQSLAQSLSELFAQKKSVQFYAQLFAELTLFACHLPIKNGIIFTFLDKKHVAILKTNKKYVPKFQKFNMIHDRKQNSLNYKK